MDAINWINSININNENPLKIEQFAATICSDHTEFVICYFQNSTTYIVSQYGKIGNLYSVETEHIENGVVSNDPLYNLHSLFGRDSIEVEAGIRYIVEQLGIKRPILFSLTLKNFSICNLKLITEAIKNWKEYSEN